MIVFCMLTAAAISLVAIVASLRQPGGALRYSFVCSAVYLAWIVPQVISISSDVTVPEGGLYWLSIMILLCLAVSLFGWWIGLELKSRRRRPLLPGQVWNDIGRIFWPIAALTAFVYLLHVLIGLRPLEEREVSGWSGPLTIIVFFMSLDIISLYLSLFLAIKERSLRSFMLAGANIFLGGTSAFIAMRRGEIIDFGIACAAAYWFGAGKRVPVAALAAAIGVVTVVTYAIVPLRIAAKEMEARTGSPVGLFSVEVWQQVNFGDAIESSSKEAYDLVNAAYLIDYSNKWGVFTYGQQSWNRFVFQWVPAQILGADFKGALMFKQGGDYQQIEAEYGYGSIGGTTSTGFGFAYQEFGLMGFVYFFAIGTLMGRLWGDAAAGDIWAQALYVSFLGGALLTVTHHAMWLIGQMPLFYLAVFVMKWATGKTSPYHRPSRQLILRKR